MLSRIKYLVLILSVTASSWLNADELLVAVAANFAQPAKQLGEMYQQRTGVKIKWVVASSGKHFSQIVHGAPFDIFLSADQEKVKQLVLLNKALKQSQFTYARGQLALYSPLAVTEPGRFKLEQIFKQPWLTRFAMANPKLAPYGIAAKHLLLQEGTYQSLRQQGKIVQGENIAQTFQFVVSKNAQAGLVAYSHVLAYKASKKHYILLAVDSYPAILQDAVLISASQNKQQASEFLAFLKTAQAKKIIHSFGYLTEH